MIYFLFLNIPIIFSIYTKVDKLLIILGVICVYSLFIYYYKSNQKNIEHMKKVIFFLTQVILIFWLYLSSGYFYNQSLDNKWAVRYKISMSDEAEIYFSAWIRY